MVDIEQLYHSHYKTFIEVCYAAISLIYTILFYFKENVNNFDYIYLAACGCKPRAANGDGWDENPPAAWPPFA